jgi:cyclopropane fatty-acyl-phospholipid synthase-like methyltransferase
VQNFFRRLLFHYWYYRKPPWDTGISPPELLEFIETHKPGRAIDIGCGTGTNVITLARAGWRVTGIDFAPRAIQLARQKLQETNIQADVQVNDATKLNGVTGLFDLALDLGCFHTIPENRRTPYLDQLDRLLAPGGFWLMYGFLKSDSRADHTPAGIAEAEISDLSTRFLPISRRDGFDNRERTSAWFLFQKKAVSPNV